MELELATPDGAGRTSAGRGNSDQVDVADAAIAIPVAASHTKAIEKPCGTVRGRRNIDATRAGLPPTFAARNGVVESPACRPR